MMMDIDKFKQYNDTRGHQAGDEVLCLVADSVRKIIRGSDLAFRYGGDEFAAILLSADPSDAKAVIKRVKRYFFARLKEADEAAAVRLGLSVGMATFPEDATTADELVRIADAAMYWAKSEGINRVGEWHDLAGASGSQVKAPTQTARRRRASASRVTTARSR